MKSNTFTIIGGIFSAITCLMITIFLIMSPTEREEWWFFFKNRSATSADWDKWQEEKRKQQIMTAMSCQPEKPLSSGERYAMAMQNFWKEKVDWHFYDDDWQEENHPTLTIDAVVTINEAICGIENAGLFSSKKVMTTDSCYPFKLEDYPTRELVLKKQQPIFNDLNIAKAARQELNGKKYDPAQGFLYQPQHYNQPSGFGVVHSHAWYVE